MPIGIRSIASKNVTLSTASDDAVRHDRPPGRGIASPHRRAGDRQQHQRPEPEPQGGDAGRPEPVEEVVRHGSRVWIATLQPTIMAAPTTARFIATPASGDTLRDEFGDRPRRCLGSSVQSESTGGRRRTSRQRYAADDRAGGRATATCTMTSGESADAAGQALATPVSYPPRIRRSAERFYWCLTPQPDVRQGAADFAQAITEAAEEEVGLHRVVFRSTCQVFPSTRRISAEALST